MCGWPIARRKRRAGLCVVRTMYRRWKPWHRQPRHGNRYAGSHGPPAAVVCQVTEPPPRHREHLSYRILNPIPADPTRAIPIHTPIVTAVQNDTRQGNSAADEASEIRHYALLPVGPLAAGEQQRSIAEADGDRTHQGSFDPSTVLKFGGSRPSGVIECLRVLPCMKLGVWPSVWCWRVWSVLGRFVSKRLAAQGCLVRTTNPESESSPGGIPSRSIRDDRGSSEGRAAPTQSAMCHRLNKPMEETWTVHYPCVPDTASVGAADGAESRHDAAHLRRRQSCANGFCRPVLRWL